MVYRFRLLSDEEDEFMLVCKLDADSTFYDLHMAILKWVGYPDDQMTSFFLCDEEWNKETEITLEDMGLGSETDIYVMKDTPLRDLLEEEHQRMIYVFDPLSERVFFIKLMEIIPGKSLKKPMLESREGKAPKQLRQIDDVAKVANDTRLDLDENFYGDEGYEADELDAEGYDFSNLADPYSNDLY